MNPLSQQITDNANQIIADAAQLDTQLSIASKKSKPTVYAGLEKLPIGPDDKTLFRWAQPGNTGNTGGGSPKPHGTYTWTPGPAGTKISIKPAGAYDNFFFYCPMTYPTVPPSRLRFTAGDWSAATSGDWNKSQQMEWQVEEFRSGFQYTCGGAVNPQSGLMYWAGAKKWQAFPGGSNINSLGAPAFIQCEYTLDQTAHTFRLEWIVFNGVMMPAGITILAVQAPISKQEYSISVQMDANSSAQAYSGLLNNLSAEWE